MASGRAPVTTLPTVSIGMPVFNGEKYIATAIDSLLGQTFEDFELVIGDNGSTDGTREICGEYAARDARVRLLTVDENRGAAWNYNRVYHASEGRLFRWAAHDDFVAPGYLARLVAALDGAPATTVLAQTGTLLVDEAGAEVGVWDDKFDLSSRHPWKRISQLARYLIMSNVFFGLIRREALERTRLHGAYPSADYVLLAELALLGPFLLLSERLFMRRVHPGMSRFAWKNLDDVADWFEPGTAGSVQPEVLRLFAEHLKAIRRSSLGAGERTAAIGAFLPVWLVRHKRAMAAELVTATRRALPFRRR
jgi:glycosyltransferase involved in cell wall biosynthesis